MLLAARFSLSGLRKLQFFRDFYDEAQRFIHGIGVGKYVRDVRFETNDVAEAFSSRSEFSYSQTSQVILRPEIIL